MTHQDTDGRRRTTQKALISWPSSHKLYSDRLVENCGLTNGSEATSTAKIDNHNYSDKNAKTAETNRIVNDIKND